ncbi:MAG TPA: hypothetical protein VGF14_01885 [Alphaproteobacteria bacterium]
MTKRIQNPFYTPGAAKSSAPSTQGRFVMYEDFTQENPAHPDFDVINELQIFDSMFSVDCPFKDLNDMSVSYN